MRPLTLEEHALSFGGLPEAEAMRLGSTRSVTDAPLPSRYVAARAALRACLPASAEYFATRASASRAALQAQRGRS